MKHKILIISVIISWFISQDVKSQYNDTLWVATWGNDASVGDSAHPFATWQKGWETVQPGSLLYIRGGIYYPSSTRPTNASVIYINPYAVPSIGYDGNRYDSISVFAYPGEEPILDCRNVSVPVQYLNGVNLERQNFLHIKGLTVRNVYQTKEATVHGFIVSQCSNLVVEGFKVYYIGGKGILNYSDFKHVNYPEQDTILGDTTRYINCDASFCMDSIGRQVGSVDIGNYADGFWMNFVDTTSFAELRGCRSWRNSDDGYDLPSAGVLHVNGCWSFSNGQFISGQGGGIRNDPAVNPTIPWVINNCISAFNKYFGFSSGYNSNPSRPVNFYNNISFHNKYGIIINRTIMDDPAIRNFNNNVFLSNTTFDLLLGDNTILHSNNYWGSKVELLGQQFTIPDHTPAVTATSADYVLVDSSQAYSEMTAARKEDGSLPDITFLSLTPTSDLIDAGIDIGLPYGGDAPDMGPFEYEGLDSTGTNIITFILPDQTETANINTTNHTVSIEVEYGTSVTALQPTITLSYGATISPTSGTATNFTNPVTYTVTALDESTQEWVVTVTVASTPNATPVVTNIPNQTITTGSSFATINLDNYVSDADNTDSQITWTYSGDTHINISITNRVATITYDNGFTGSETITFTATDPDNLSDSDQAVFTVNAASTPSGTCLLRINYAGSKKIRQGSERRIGIN